MVTGHLPFDDEHIPKLLKKIKSGKYRSLPDYLSVDVKDLIQRMLVVDANQRMNVKKNVWFTIYKNLKITFRCLKYWFILG
jgi:serine/threonine protein kinase